MDYWDKKLRCGHAGVRVFNFALGGAAYTSKDLAESLAGKDRYELEKFFAPRTVLTLSESIGRFIERGTGFPFKRDGIPPPSAPDISGLRKHLQASQPCPRLRGPAGLLEDLPCTNVGNQHGYHSHL
jgi:hypothetical protein